MFIMSRFRFNLILCVLFFCLLSLNSASMILSRTASFVDSKKRCVCGESKSPRVFDGEYAHPGDFPWMIRLYALNDIFGSWHHQCGGSLITRRHIVTTAHCFPVDYSQSDAKFFKTQTQDGKNHSIESVLIHKSFDRLRGDNDIAILKLDDPINLDKSVQTICLPAHPYSYYDDQWGIVTGWGVFNASWIPSDRLLKASVKLMSHKNCIAQTNWEIDRITKNMFCAVGDRQDACNGDSGGPLQIYNVLGVAELIGIVSKGKNFICGEKKYPGVYTKIGNYVNWIHDIIKDENFCEYYYSL